MGYANVFLLTGGLVFVGLVLYYSYPKRRKLTEEEVNNEILIRVTSVLANIINDTVGQHFTEGERYEIAIGMLTVMVNRNISIDQLFGNQQLFQEAMMESINTLIEGR
jgi:hypothetical protein